jgi:hypothetical protein
MRRLEMQNQLQSQRQKNNLRLGVVISEELVMHNKKHGELFLL